MLRRTKIDHVLSAMSPIEGHFQNENLEKNDVEMNFKRSTQSRALYERALVLLQKIIKNMTNKTIRVKACSDCSRKIPTLTVNPLTQVLNRSSVPYEEMKYVTKFESGGFDDHSIDLYLKDKSTEYKANLSVIEFESK